MKKILITLILNAVITLSILSIFIFFAQNAHPTSSLYNLKRVAEHLTLATRLTPISKAEYQIILLEKRFQEIEQVFKSRDFKHLLVTSLRYSTTAGELAEIIRSNSLTEQSNRTKIIFARHTKRLTVLRQNTPKKIIEEKFLQDSINYLNTYTQQLPK